MSLAHAYGGRGGDPRKGHAAHPPPTTCLAESDLSLIFPDVDLSIASSSPLPSPLLSYAPRHCSATHTQRERERSPASSTIDRQAEEERKEKTCEKSISHTWHCIVRGPVCVLCYYYMPIPSHRPPVCDPLTRLSATRRSPLLQYCVQYFQQGCMETRSCRNLGWRRRWPYCPAVSWTSSRWVLNNCTPSGHVSRKRAAE